MISVFDMFSIGIGPSSSHTVGPMRAAKLFVDELIKTQQLEQVDRVKAELFGSLGQTGIGHGTGKAVILGLTGQTPEDIPVEKIDSTLAEVEASEKIALNGEHVVDFPKSDAIIYHRRKTLPAHANAMTIFAYVNDEVILEKTLSVCDIVTHHRLIERHHGDFTGRDKTELLLEYGEKKFRSFKRSLDVAYPNGESVYDVVDRLTSWLAEQLLPLHEKGHVLVVSHTDTIKALNLLLELITDVEAVDFAIATGEAIYVPWITVKNNVLV